MPTPRPIIVATVGATSGTATRWPSSETMLRPQMSPKIATAIGRTIAVTVPKTTTRMSIAAAMPMISLVFASALEIFVPSWPPASTARRCPRRAHARSRGSPRPARRTGRRARSTGSTVRVGGLAVLETVVLPAWKGSLTPGRCRPATAPSGTPRRPGGAASSVSVPESAW